MLSKIWISARYQSQSHPQATWACWVTEQLKSVPRISPSFISNFSDRFEAKMEL